MENFNSIPGRFNTPTYKKIFRLESYCVEEEYLLQQRRRERKSEWVQGMGREAFPYERHLATTLAKNESKIAPTHLAATQVGKESCLIFARRDDPRSKLLIIVFSSQENMLLHYSPTTSR